MIFSKLKNNVFKGYIAYPKAKGFTILETLVAITIILIAITGPLDIIAHSLKASYYSRDEVTAFYFAQEAIEYAVNQRNNNALNNDTIVDNWLTGVTGTGGINCLNDANITEDNKNKCALVQTNGGVYSYESCGTSCRDGGIIMKRFSSADDDGIYGATGGDPSSLEDTNFTREIYFTKVVDASKSPTDPLGQSRNEVLMTVKVYWSNSFGTDNKFTINTRLFNWKITYTGA